MELVVKMPTIAEAIDCNFEEVKAWVSEKAEFYKGLTYTDDQVKEAKADRATLNKVKKAFNDERIRVKKEYMKPIEDFERKCNELVNIVDAVSEDIAKQITAFDERRKQEKNEAVLNLFYSDVKRPEWLDFEMIRDKRWLNATYSLSTVKTDISERLAKIEEDMATLSGLPDFGFEAVEVYKRTLDVNQAINKAKDMAEIQKRKEEAKRRAEEEAQRRAEAEAKAKAEAAEKAQQPMTQEEAEAKAAAIVDQINQAMNQEVPRRWIAFQALLSNEDAMALKQFFIDRNIKFKRA